MKGVGRGAWVWLGLTLAAPACGRATHNPSEPADIGAGGESAGSASLGGQQEPDEAGAPSSPPSGQGGQSGQDAQGGQSGQAGDNFESQAGMPAEPPFQPTDCRGKPLELDADHLRSCVLLASCTHAVDITDCVRSPGSPTAYYRVGSDIGSRTERPAEPALPLSGCSDTLTSCDDVLSCTGFRLPIAECQASRAARCDGDLAINCDGEGDVTDCARTLGVSGACRVVGSGASARAHCAPDGACAAAESCQGSVRTRCANGVVEGLDCGEFGLTCEQSAGGARCVSPLPTETCDKPGRVYCDGDSRALCNADGVLFKAPACSLAGDLACSETSDMLYDWVHCAAKNCPGSYEEYASQCDGDDYLLKSDFDSLRVHCPAYGFSTCRDGYCTN